MTFPAAIIAVASKAFLTARQGRSDTGRFDDEEVVV
jgi:hypothetical protein